MVRPKNVLGVLMQNFTAMGLIAVVWAVAGLSLAFGDFGNGGSGRRLTRDSGILLRGVVRHCQGSRRRYRIRVSRDDEETGLDLSPHAETAYSLM
jgi:ammonia channel protein AmtB